MLPKDACHAMDIKENKLLDVFKFVAALLILASHCLPLVQNDSFNFYYGQWFFRFCVPLFFISSGFFFTSFSQKTKLKYIKRIAVLYLISNLIYLPQYATRDLGATLRNLILGYYHLWYLSALLIALILCYFLEKAFAFRAVRKSYPFLIAVLILIGAFYDEYQAVFTGLRDTALASGIGEWVEWLGGARHALFFALPMILIGKFLYEYREKIRLSSPMCLLLLAASFLLSLLECMMLRHFGGPYITNDITLVNYFPAVFLFLLSFSLRPQALEARNTRTLRKVSDIVYVSHVLVMVVVGSLWELSYLPRLAVVTLLSVAVSRLYVKLEHVIKSGFRELCNR